MEENKKVEITGHYAATLSIIEIGLGSFLHALHIPFSGIILSLNQGFILSRAAIFSREFPGNTWTTYNISNVVAVLKSLSPAGKKLGPMLSLSMQGLLFNLGTLFFGINPVGLCAGMAFLSVWTFLQPLITYYFFFGEKLFSAAQYLFDKTLPYHGIKAELVLWVFVALVVTKMLVGIGLGILAWKTQGNSIYGNHYDEKLMNLAKARGLKISSEESNSKHAAWLALKDLFRPIFLVSLTMTGVFLYFSESDHSKIIWYLLRPLALGFIFFYFSRTMTLDRWLLKMGQGKFRSFSLACQTALAKIRSFLS
jgi:hypothetical protein